MSKANSKFKKAVVKAKALYKTGRYKTFADAVKSAYKKIGSATPAKKKAAKRYQTGTSKIAADRMRKAKPPGKRTSASGRPYTERRKNRSDMPNKLTGVSAASLVSELRMRLKDNLGKQLVRREMATTKRDKRKVSKQISETKSRLRKLA